MKSESKVCTAWWMTADFRWTFRTHSHVDDKIGEWLSNWTVVYISYMASCLRVRKKNPASWLLCWENGAFVEDVVCATEMSCLRRAWQSCGCYGSVVAPMAMHTNHVTSPCARGCGLAVRLELSVSQKQRWHCRLTITHWPCQWLDVYDYDWHRHSHRRLWLCLWLWRLCLCLTIFMHLLDVLWLWLCSVQLTWSWLDSRLKSSRAVFQLGIFLRALRPARTGLRPTRFTSALPELFKKKKKLLLLILFSY